MYPVLRKSTQLAPKDSITYSRFPTLADIDTTCKKTEYRDVRFVAVRCADNLVRLWPTGEVGNNFMNY